MMEYLSIFLLIWMQALERFDVFRDIQPSYVVLYDADIAVIRGIEAYQSTLSRGDRPVKVYFLMYGTCAETRTCVNTCIYMHFIYFDVHANVRTLTCVNCLSLIYIYIRTHTQMAVQSSTDTQDRFQRRRKRLNHSQSRRKLW